MTPDRGAGLGPETMEVSMAKRCCRNCVYAVRPKGHWLRILLERWPGLLLCASSPTARGQLTEVNAEGVCRNFRPKRRPPTRHMPPQPADPEIRYIGLTHGKVATVDAADYPWLSQYPWSAKRLGRKWYACWRRGRRTIFMHRLIMQPGPGLVVDHIDGNGLNNRRRNLRNCTPRQNACNRAPAGAGSRFAGVYPAGQKWGARISHKGKEYPLGLFDDEREAALARDRMALELQGKFAWLNLPEEIYNHPPNDRPPAQDADETKSP